MILFAHFSRTRNVGDLASGPYQWFDFPPQRVLDIRDPLPDARVAIYGGGALTPLLANAPLPGGIRVAWGIGSSMHGQTDPHPNPANYDLLGIREYVDPGLYVPCSSCMCTLFDRAYRIEHEAVLFFNDDPAVLSRYPLRLDAAMPRLDNKQPLERVIPFLASGETVVTNSYHGWYWATLLGRRVVCVAYSSKFHRVKFPPALSADGSDWAAARTTTYPDALGDSRSLNEIFYRKVLALL